MQMKITEETKRADKAEFETKRLNEKLVSLQREKEVSISPLMYDGVCETRICHIHDELLRSSYTKFHSCPTRMDEMQNV